MCKVIQLREFHIIQNYERSTAKLAINQITSKSHSSWLNHFALLYRALTLSVLDISFLKHVFTSAMHIKRLSQSNAISSRQFTTSVIAFAFIIAEHDFETKNQKCSL